MKYQSRVSIRAVLALRLLKRILKNPGRNKREEKTRGATQRVQKSANIQIFLGNFFVVIFLCSPSIILIFPNFSYFSKPERALREKYTPPGRNIYPISCYQWVQLKFYLFRWNPCPVYHPILLWDKANPLKGCQDLHWGEKILKRDKTLTESSTSIIPVFLISRVLGQIWPFCQVWTAQTSWYCPVTPDLILSVCVQGWYVTTDSPNICGEMIRRWDVSYVSCLWYQHTGRCDRCRYEMNFQKFFFVVVGGSW